MNPKVHKDVLAVLSKAITLLKTPSQKVKTALAELSDHTIHCCTVFQDEDSMNIGVLIYAIAKTIKFPPDKKRKSLLLNILKTAKLVINGNERFEQRDAKYFRLVQPFYHHTRIPNNFIYCYSFAIKPEHHQPSGTLNFSRIDNCQLSLTCIQNSNSCNVNVYAINYNIFKIMSGMGGLLYSN